MRRLLIAFALLASSAFGQCQFTGTLTAAGAGSNFDNRNTACTQFQWNYIATSDVNSSILISLQGAPDNAGTPGTFSDLVSYNAANPNGALGNQLVLFRGVSSQWLRVMVYSIAGSAPSVSFTTNGQNLSPRQPVAQSWEAVTHVWSGTNPETFSFTGVTASSLCLTSAASLTAFRTNVFSGYISSVSTDTVTLSFANPPTAGALVNVACFQ